jgi:hypothetical protein
VALVLGNETLITDAEAYAMIDSIGDVAAALKDAEPDSLERLYRELGRGSATNHGSEQWTFCSLHVWLTDVSEGGVAH